MGFSDIIKKCEKDWDCPDLMTSVTKFDGKKIPFSSPSLNYMTYGGIPRAAISHFFGYEGGGKSSTAIDECNRALHLFEQEYAEEVARLETEAASGKKDAKIKLQDLKNVGPKKIVYVDMERSFSRSWANTIGLDIDDIYVMQPPNVSAESVLQSIQDLITTGEVGLLVIDSIPSLVPQKLLDKKFGEVSVAPLAGLLTQFLYKVNQLLKMYDCTLILINQIRDNMTNPFAVNTPGGRALRFYSSLMLEFKLGNPVDFLGNELAQKVESAAGYKIIVRETKQKSAPFDRKQGEYYLMAQTGLRPDFEFATLAIAKYNIIQKTKGWYTICDPVTKEPLEVDGNIVKVNGLANVYAYLQNNPDYYDGMCKFILDDINNSETETTLADDLDE